MSDFETRRLLLAHPKNVEDESIDVLAELTKAVLTGAPLASGKRCAPVIVTGRDDFKRFEEDHPDMPRAAIWGQWIDALFAVDAYQAPRYHGFVVAPYPRIGKATAEIVNRALGANRAVLFYGGNGSPSRVRAVSWEDRRDFKTGWKVVTG